jgi:hypothetical protein
VSRREGADARAHRGRAGNAHRGKGRGGGGGEREGEGEGEGRGAHLGVQILRSPSPKPRAPRGERDGREREVTAREKSNGRKRPGEGVRMGARGARAELGHARSGWAGSGRAGLGRTAGQNPVERTTTDRNSIREAKSETELSNARD